MKIALIEILLAVLGIGSFVWYINGDFANKFEEFIVCVISAASIVVFILWTFLAVLLN